MTTSIKLPEKIRTIDVYTGEVYAGRLSRDARHHFIYDSPDVPSISLTMATNKGEPFSYGDLHPIFRQNLPEGFIRRYITEKLIRHDKTIRLDDMYLLALQQANGIGQLGYRSEIELPDVSGISLSDVLQWKGEELLFPQLLEKYYLRGMLSGVQPKVALDIQDRTIEQKAFIVKTFDEDFPLLTVNEYVCMTAARDCGLNPPDVFLSESFETFVIERFDRGDEPLGFEDFTTLMKKKERPDAKYEGSYENLLKAVAIYTRSQAEVAKAYQYIVFNCLIGNGDAHLKNFALQYAQDLSRVWMSPIYDVTHTCIYGGGNASLALTIQKSRTFPDKNALIKLANVQGYEIHQPERVIESLAEGILQSIASSDVVTEFFGLRESIERSVHTGAGVSYNPKGYRHEKIKKFKD